MKLSTLELVNQAQRLGYSQVMIAEITNTSQPTIARIIKDEDVAEKGQMLKINYRLEHFLQAVEYMGEIFFMRGAA